MIKFQSSNGSLCGGFSDQPWQSDIPRGKYIPSDRWDFKYTHSTIFIILWNLIEWPNCILASTNQRKSILLLHDVSYQSASLVPMVHSYI